MAALLTLCAPSSASAIYYTILYYTILYCTILYYTILYYTILYYTILYYTILYYTILYYTILYYTILYYTILYYTILYYTILYYTIHYTILDYPAALEVSELLGSSCWEQEWIGLGSGHGEKRTARPVPIPSAAEMAAPPAFPPAPGGSKESIGSELFLMRRWRETSL